MSDSSVAEKPSLLITDLQTFVKQSVSEMDSRKLRNLKRESARIMAAAERRASNPGAGRETEK
jgi:hypothetical protein